VGQAGVAVFQAETLKVRRQAGLSQVDAIAVHRDALGEKESSLPMAFRDGAVGADDAMPGETLGGCEDVPDETGSAWIDVAVGTDEALRDGSYAGHDALLPRLTGASVGADPTVRPESIASTARRDRRQIGHRETLPKGARWDLEAVAYLCVEVVNPSRPSGSGILSSSREIGMRSWWRDDLCNRTEDCRLHACPGKTACAAGRSIQDGRRSRSE
jgi:hypothetical protein